MKLGLFLIFCFVWQSHFQAFWASDHIPSSARSRQATERIKPFLESEMQLKGLQWGNPVYMRIFKKEKQLEVWVKKDESFILLKTYRICTFGHRGLGPKLREGDERAPEGFYFVTPSQMNPSSQFHLSFNLGYPNQYDRFHGRTGSALMVHGGCVSIGCYAMTDNSIEEIYALADAALRNGQPFFRVHIFPFMMTEFNMSNHKLDPLYSFWENLREGYDFFYNNGNNPPNVTVWGGEYLFD